MKHYLNQAIHIVIDRPLGSLHPEHGFRYEINYGFVPGTVSGDGEEIDAYVIGVEEALDGSPLSMERQMQNATPHPNPLPQGAKEIYGEFEGRCVAIIHRLDDDDDKLVLVPESMVDISDKEIIRATHFQEWAFEIEIWR